MRAFLAKVKKVVRLIDTPDLRVSVNLKLLDGFCKAFQDSANHLEKMHEYSSSFVK